MSDDGAEGQTLQNQHYDEEYPVDDDEDVASNLAESPDGMRMPDRDEMGSRGDSPPEDDGDPGDDDEYDEDEVIHGDDGLAGDSLGGDGLGDSLGGGDGLEMTPGPDDEDADLDDYNPMHQRDRDFGPGGGDMGGRDDVQFEDDHPDDGDDGMSPLSPDPDHGADDSLQDSRGPTKVIEGAYDPADYENLSVSDEIKDLFQYISRYNAQSQELETRLKPFIPDFIPAVGDIDAMIQIRRADGVNQGLGLEVLDEPCADQADPTVLDLQLRSISKTSTTKAVAVKKVGGGGKEAATKAIDSWIASITELHRDKPPQSVNYSTMMPEIETLMQEWPTEFEELLSSGVRLPDADLNCTLKEYVHIVCSLCDVPIHKSRIESLHLLFTLFSEFKASQHFRTQDEAEEVEQAAVVEAEVDVMTFD